MKKKFMITLIIASISLVALYSTVFKSFFQENTVDASHDYEGEGEEYIGGEDGTINKEKNEILFLLMGVDTEDVRKSKGTRTDTIILTRINFDTGETAMLSIPRDTRVSIKGKADKLNHSFAYGGKDLTLETVKDFLGINLDYYAIIDYKFVKEVVDAIGGVKIDVPFDMVYTADPPLHINIKKGERVLNGKQAHDFLRWRHNNDKSVAYKEGDIGRIQAQQYFMKELIKQTLKPKNLLRLPKLIETYFDNVETNIPINIILKGATSAKKIDVENINAKTVPGSGEYIEGISYWLPDREQTRSMIKEMFEGYFD